MQQKLASSNHKIWLWLLIVVFAILGTACCYAAWKVMFPAETRAPEVFPETDIVFVASGKKVGFVNAAGNNPEYLPLVINGYGMAWPWRPVVTGDNRTLIVKMIDHVEFVSSPGLLAIWHSNTIPTLCDNWLFQQVPLLTTDQQHIFIQVEKGIAVYTLDSCDTEEQPVKVFESILGIPSPDFKYVAYVNRINDLYHNRVLFVKDIGDGNERIIGEGNFPMWSRDGKWLAYTGPDGIYVYNISENVQPRRVVIYLHPGNIAFPLYLGGTEHIPPEVSWSSDGKWLVYHKWIGTEQTSIVDPNSYAIYKLNLETGEETKIIDGGMYPYWRWPAEQPGE
ncbi:MAG: hypothetical protein Fur0043_08500 [Anaerolineales bacterium]